jgi:hypothetical protein
MLLCMRTPLLLFITLLVVVACTPTPTPTIPSTPTITVLTSTHTPIPSATANETATEIATASSVPTESTPTPPTPIATETVNDTIAEYPVTLLPLAAPLDEADAEISGMAWYSDTLVLLPQFPERYSNQLFGVPQSDIRSHIESKTPETLNPILIAFDDGNLHNTIRGFEGYEAIAFIENQVYVTMEVRLTATTMTGYLVSGTVTVDEGIQLNPDTLIELPAPVALENYSDEAITTWGNTLYTFYEANGANVNAAAVARQFDLTTLAPQNSLELPPLEYRLTDATPAEPSGQFWVINYLFPGDLPKLLPASDYFAEMYGMGASHERDLGVERLIQYQITDEGIEPTDTPPVYLTLERGNPRNWEGIAILEGEGFLLATDKFPATLLGFVPYSE